MFRFAVPFLAATLLLAGEPTPQGLLLAGKLDAMEVETHWLAGARVDWRTGLPDSGRPAKTHCSAFVAAACERLGVYLLRPPDHNQVHLATAQAEWLEREGARRGWAAVASPARAQGLANEGWLVVAVYPSPDPLRSGHAALVRPSGKSAALLEAEGPQVIQAGAENAASTSLKTGFRHHRRAWAPDGTCQVHFYAHEIPWGAHSAPKAKSGIMSITGSQQPMPTRPSP